MLSTAVGVLTLRTSGVSFLIVTLMFAQVFYLSTLYFNRFTLGDQGFVLSGHLHPITIGPIRFALTDPAVRYNLALATFGGCLGLSLWLVRSPIGRVLVAIRENEDRTRLLGYNPFAYKLLVLVISGAVSGLCGSVFAVITSYVGASFAAILYSIYPLLWTLLGGPGTTLGPLVGAAAMTYTVEVASRFTSSYLIVVGGALVLVVGPLIGVLLILSTNAPFWLVNVIAGIVYAVTMPFVALTTGYVYFDARVRSELAGERETAVLPEEVGLSFRFE